MDASEILNQLPEYGATKVVEFAPGITLTIRGIQSWDEYRAVAKQAEHVKKRGGSSVPVGNKTVFVPDDLMLEYVYVQNAIAEPAFTYSQVVALATRAGVAFGKLQAEIAKLSGANLDEAVEAAAPTDQFPCADPASCDEDAPAAVGSGDVAGE